MLHIKERNLDTGIVMWSYQLMKLTAVNANP